MNVIASFGCTTVGTRDSHTVSSALLSSGQCLGDDVKDTSLHSRYFPR